MFRDKKRGSDTIVETKTTGGRMLNKMGRQGGRKAFSLVEILIVILIIAVLLAVALPQLVGSRDAGLDSAAKQQLNNAYTELSAKTLTTESSPADAAAASSSIKTIEFVGESVAGGKQANSTTNTRAVSYKRVGTQGFILAVAGSGTNCWALRVDPAETNKPMAYLGKKTVTTCSANYASTLAVSSTDWEQFGFPSEAKP